MTYAEKIINPETGEEITDVHLISHEEYLRNRNYKQLADDYDARKQEMDQRYKDYGKFIWLLYNLGQDIDWGISPECLIKIIYLSTYARYKDNVLIMNNRNHMTKQDMQTALKLGKQGFYNFYNEVTSAGVLIENDNKTFSLNPALFVRDKIKDGDYDCKLIRVYFNSVRQLYEQAKKSEHKFLSYIFQAIPHLNINYNMMCHNPEEEDLELISPMTMKEFCKVIGYYEDGDRKLKTKMKHITLNGVPVFSFVDNNRGLFCYINPKVLYAGNARERVEVLGKFCDEIV